MIELVFCLLVTAPSVDEVVAQVGLEQVTVSQLSEREASTRAKGGATRLDLLLEDLINDALMAQDGYKAGLAKDPAVVEKVATERARLAGERLLEKEIVTAAKVTDAQLLEAYHSSGDNAHLKLIVLATEPAAVELLARLRKGASFSDEAKQSLDPQTAGAGGDYGTRMRGQLEQALATVAFTAPVGALSGPVKLSLGYAVVQVVSRDVADPKGFEAKKAELRQYLEGQLRARYRQHYVMQLRQAAKATIDEAFIRSTETRLKATPEEAAHLISTVGGRKIVYGEVLAAASASFGGKEGGHFSGPAVKTELSWNLVDRALLEQAALKRGLGDDPSVVAALRRFEHDEVARARARQLRAGVPAPTNAELEQWYQEHAADFRVPAERPCSHLVVKDRGQAEQLRARLMRGDNFGELAREYSQDPGSSAQGGFLGAVTDDRIAAYAKAEPQLAAAFRDAKPGEVGAPVQSRLGWHLVSCGALRPAGQKPLAEVRDGISAQLRAERGDRAVVQQLAQLRAAVSISRDQAALDKAVARRQP